ncbi:DNA repair helicase rad15 [Smittium mucronatum]|uniref:DNA 5'-3' helicase n=1 Tax=Smittium mucronatum TaxID=133383 RepID=A0A1R0GWI5_9FUNG|nr:DNA repair helicase rad15 [Smittium mucronatum]OLY81876.1 DNA repair helicase rad15 [Smittium mucronatum]
MPSGTGKTVSLLSLTIAYQQFYPNKRKIVYCSRTVPEIDKALAELKRLMKYRASHGSSDEGFLGVGLSSRRNLCLNPKLSKERSGKIVDARCRAMTSSWVRDKAKSDHSIETCSYFEISVADVVIFSYHYVLDPKITELVSKDFSKDTIVIFDEAHNIDSTCIEALSIDLNLEKLEASTKSVEQLSLKIEEVKNTDASKLQDEYNSLLEGLKEAGEARLNDLVIENPILPDDLLFEAVPGNIRKAEHFVSFLKRFIEYVKARMRVMHVVAETTTSFLQHLKEVTFIDKKPLQFCAQRLTSLVRTLEITDLEDYWGLQKVVAFATLCATYDEGFLVLFEPFESDTATIPNPILNLACLDAAIAMRPIVERFHTVVITSGTLSPLEMYPKMLKIRAVVMESYTMTLTRSSFLPLIVTRGSDQVSISSKFEVRNDPAVVRNFGNLLIEMCKTVPDGLVAFFPSYLYMESIVAMWNEMGILKSVYKHKLIFVETPDTAETSLALESYRKGCENGRGAVLFSVARGKVSEGVDFDHNYGRAVIMFGIPYQYTESRILKARLEFMREKYQIRENDFLSFDAIRHASQCVGRVLRGKSDYGLMLFADKRYSRQDKKSKLPAWISTNILESYNNLSTDMAVSAAKHFLKNMAQPFDQSKQIGHSLWSEQDILQRKRISHDSTHV